MTDPSSMFGASTGMTMLGAGVGAFSQIMAGDASSSMFRYQAGVAQLNKELALQNADYARKAGEVAAQESGMKTRAEIGTTRAAQGASGIDIGSDSSVAVRKSEAAIGVQNQSIIRANAARVAYGYEVAAAKEDAQTEMYRASGKNVERAAMIGAATSLLGGATSVASKWYQASQSGIIGDNSGSMDLGFGRSIT